ncbi:hypothetical protein QYF36_025319 [Acer negundo]|nr:hypothetical protein QYF36_025319 [Acer negundo]
MVQKFIRGCPLLEDLFLSPIWHSDSVCVSPAPKLKILTIDLSSGFSNVDIIEIVSPSLQQCTIISVLSGCVIDMAGCYDLKFLDLTDAAISDEDFHNLILKFPLLEKLILCDCTVEKIAFSSNRLRELEVLDCDSLISIDIDIDIVQLNAPCFFSLVSHSLSKTIIWFYKKMTNRDVECSNHQGIKCWQYYLRDFKIESFIPFEDQEPLHIDNLMAVLPELEAGTIRFHLDWCFS